VETRSYCVVAEAVENRDAIIGARDSER
jgi:hypothetical protein